MTRPACTFLHCHTQGFGFVSYPLKNAWAWPEASWEPAGKSMAYARMPLPVFVPPFRAVQSIRGDMLVSHEREKLINAIIYFANHTRFLGKTKLCKLLYFLDFEHFKETGRSVTGMEYFAWKMGPVPVDLYEEVDMPEPDMADRVEFIEKPTRRGSPMLVVRPISDFDDAHFTKRELRIMRSLADEYRDTQAENMIEATHLENQPWHKIYVEEGRRQEHIPYDLALRRQEAEAMHDVIAERQAFVEHFRQA